VPLRTEKENEFLLRKEEKLFDAEIGVQTLRGCVDDPTGGRVIQRLR
jgi:hypothetical protein